MYAFLQFADGNSQYLFCVRLLMPEHVPFIPSVKHSLSEEHSMYLNLSVPFTQTPFLQVLSSPHANVSLKKKRKLISERVVISNKFNVIMNLFVCVRVNDFL